MSVFAPEESEYQALGRLATNAGFRSELIRLTPVRIAAWGTYRPNGRGVDPSAGAV